MSDIEIDKLPKKTEIEESKPTKFVVNNPKKSPKRKTKTEIEKLKLERFESASEKRNRPDLSSTFSSINNSAYSTRVKTNTSHTILFQATDVGYGADWLLTDEVDLLPGGEQGRYDGIADWEELLFGLNIEENLEKKSPIFLI